MYIYSYVFVKKNVSFFLSFITIFSVGGGGGGRKNLTLDSQDISISNCNKLH